MTPGQERWAEAIAIERWKGDQAPVYVAERIGVLTVEGDAEGVQRFREIAARLVRLMRGERP